MKLSVVPQRPPRYRDELIYVERERWGEKEREAERDHGANRDLEKSGKKNKDLDFFRGNRGPDFS